MSTTCVFPHCPKPASGRNRAQQDTCKDHDMVVVGIGGGIDAEKPGDPDD